jgi:hypothetical protein
MMEPVSIKESSVKDDSVDLHLLKEQGLRKIQELSGKQWTDFNFHDPGVTILEVLCYALTDLAYRADFEISDLLNTEGREKIKDALFPPEEILTTNALSTLDFKRLILDMKGVKNCTIAPYLHERTIPGVFDIQIEIHPDYEDEEFREGIKKKIVQLVETNRPLGIDFSEPVFMEHEPIGILLDLELTNDIDPKKIFSEFVQCVQNYFSPEIKFRSLQELWEKGIPVEKIFDGPVLKNGFLLEEEILQHSVRQQIFVSDLMSLIMAIPGVSFVHELKIIGKQNQPFNWIYNVPGNKTPKLDPRTTTFICRYKNTIVYKSEPSSIELRFSPHLNRTSSHRQNTLDVPKGVSRNLKKYHSVQNDFPETYGIGAKGPAAGASDEKLGAIKQLKGYLMIYDQIMGNFLAQLDHVKYLFSTEDIDHTYAVQFLEELPGIELLYTKFVENYLVTHHDFDDKIKLKAAWVRFLDTTKEKITWQIRNARETREEFLRRRNTALNHMLARFGVETYKIELLTDLHPADAIKYKLELLRHFPKLSAEKHSTGPSSVKSGISGIHCWIGKNLNLAGLSKRQLTDVINTKADPEHPGFSFKIHSLKGGDPLKIVLKQVSDMELLVENGDEISVLDAENKPVSTITLSGVHTENKKEFVSGQLRRIDRESENFRIIDHITLKPTDDMPCFGFNVMTDNMPFFISERRYTLTAANDFADEFTELCKKKENFAIIETAMKEYRIKFNCSHGDLLTRMYYSTREAAEEKLDYFLYSTKDRIPDYLFFTKYEDHYINLSNPFSYIVTVLLPTWPSKFQKEGFRKYMEEYLYEELPSHLAVNMKWLDFEAMRILEQHLEAYDAIEKTGSAPAKMKALDALMDVLIS